ncbi:MAG: DUF4390 domain-containing protein [Nitrospirae bacterium]|nr:MAG: DUF4390 domain-containing protein [Nitrospirota bacterium]
MRYKILFLLIAVIFLIIPLNLRAEEPPLVIEGPEILIIKDSTIGVNFNLNLSPQYREAIKKGLTKEFNIYIDLFRHWNVWPDEFIKGKKYVRTFSIDPIKKEFIGGSFDGKVYLYKRFKGPESLIDWFLRFDNAYETTLEGLEPGRYYIKITVESKKSGLSSLISNILIILPVHEVKVEKNSPFLLWDGKTLKVER